MNLQHLQKQFVEIGDRIVIHSERRELAHMAGQSGLVVAVFDAPRGSCTVRLEETKAQNDIFVYRSEITHDRS